MGIGGTLGGIGGGLISPITSTLGGLSGGAISGFANPFFSGLGMPNPLQPAPMPTAPDFTGAAEATAAGNLAGAEAATQANRVNQVNPFGSLQWSQNPDGTWTQNVSFSPQQQKLWDLTSQGKMDLLGSSMPTFGANREAVMDAMMARSTADIGRDRENMESQLIARGIPRNSPAFDTEMDRFDRRLNDARNQAEISATQQAAQEYGAGLAGRGQQMNMLSAWTPTSPAFNQFYNQQAVPGADYLGATGQQAQWDLGGYNAQQQMRNNMLQGLFSLGGAGIMASDRRLKKNIKKIGKSKGFNLYEFSYIWENKKRTGFMADEVKMTRPDAVITDINGYDKVNYGRL